MSENAVVSLEKNKKNKAPSSSRRRMQKDPSSTPSSDDEQAKNASSAVAVVVGERGGGGDGDERTAILPMANDVIKKKKRRAVKETKTSTSTSSSLCATMEAASPDPVEAIPAPVREETRRKKKQESKDSTDAASDVRVGPDASGATRRRIDKKKKTIAVADQLEMVSPVTESVTESVAERSTAADGSHRPELASSDVGGGGGGDADVSVIVSSVLRKKKVAKKVTGTGSETDQVSSKQQQQSTKETKQHAEQDAEQSVTEEKTTTIVNVEKKKKKRMDAAPSPSQRTDTSAGAPDTSADVASGTTPDAAVVSTTSTITTSCNGDKRKDNGDDKKNRNTCIERKTIKVVKVVPTHADDGDSVVDVDVRADSGGVVVVEKKLRRKKKSSSDDNDAQQQQQDARTMSELEQTILRGEEAIKEYQRAYVTLYKALNERDGSLCCIDRFRASVRTHFDNETAEWITARVAYIRRIRAVGKDMRNAFVSPFGVAYGFVVDEDDDDDDDGDKDAGGEKTIKCIEVLWEASDELKVVTMARSGNCFASSSSSSCAISIVPEGPFFADNRRFTELDDARRSGGKGYKKATQFTAGVIPQEYIPACIAWVLLAIDHRSIVNEQVIGHVTWVDKDEYLRKSTITTPPPAQRQQRQESLATTTGTATTSMSSSTSALKKTKKSSTT